MRTLSPTLIWSGILRNEQTSSFLQLARCLILPRPARPCKLAVSVTLFQSGQRDIDFYVRLGYTEAVDE